MTSTSTKLPQIVIIS